MPTAKRIQIPAIKVPDTFKGKQSTILGKNILFVETHIDDNPPNPCTDWDGTGFIRSLSRRHINNIGIDEALDLLKTDEDVIALSYFEHGRSLWMVQELPSPAGVEFQWDGIKFAGVWIPDKSVRESYTGQDGLTRRVWMVKQAESACEIYTQFCNGDVYGYSVSVYKIRKDRAGEPFDHKDDYRRDTPIYEDSCLGLYGWDSLTEETIGSIRQALTEMKFSKRAIAAAMKQ